MRSSWPAACSSVVVRTWCSAPRATCFRSPSTATPIIAQPRAGTLTWRLGSGPTGCRTRRMRSPKPLRSIAASMPCRQPGCGSNATTLHPSAAATSA
eukprot:scaffold65396_cov73-Phaeocystis_antarctica.AAC.3